MNNEDIALVGMACMFPGADTPSQYWHNIVNKVDCITAAPPDWQSDLFYDPTGQEPDRSYTNRGGFLGDLCRFDPTKFGIPPRSVEGSEPDHFIAMRCAHEALRDAGVPDFPINRERTGVIVGRGLFINRGWASVFQRTFVVDQVINILRQLEPGRSQDDLAAIKQELKRQLPPTNAETVPGLVHSALVGRIANRLDLRGPAFTVDAACSSALMAVDMGMRELRNGTCDAMVVGAAQVSTPATIHVIFCYLNALSRSGSISPFSVDANGTLLGQGCGMVVLKRRRDAERDGNRIYALLKSIGVSSDGRGAALLAPLSEGQQLAIDRAYTSAGISPSTIGLIEAHGTGIPLGDRTEVQSLKQCFPNATEDGRRIALGAVKSMIGHLIPAAGIASLIKTSLAVYHRVLPPTLHADKPNPELGLANSRFFLCNEARPWLRSDPDTPRRAGVNAFGFGGINTHAILEEHAPENEIALPRLERHWSHELVIVSGANRQSLAARVEWLAAWVGRAEGASLLDIAAACARESDRSRITIVARDREDLIKKLRHASRLLRDESRPQIQDRQGIYWYSEPLARQGGIAFLFPGEGAQYINMMQEVCRHFPHVRRQFDLTAVALQSRAPQMCLGHVLYPQPQHEQEAEEALLQLEVAVAAVTAAGRGYLELLREFHVTPDAIVGHSSGEFGALLAAGVYRPANDAEAMEAIVAGAHSAAQLQRSGLVPRGALMAVGGVNAEALKEILGDARGRLSVAMDNCPHQKVLAGDEDAVNTAVNSLRGHGGLCERLPWDRAYHTDAFAPACEIIDQFYRRFELHRPKIELWSCATASRFPDDPAEIRQLAVRQWHSSVRFHETVLAMHEAGSRVFVELGPRGNLSSFVSDTLAGVPHAAIALDVQRKGGIEQLCRALAVLVAHGAAVNLRPLFDSRLPQPLDLDQTPPPAPRRDPPLDLSLPVLRISDDLLPELMRSSLDSRSLARDLGGTRELGELGGELGTPIVRELGTPPVDKLPAQPAPAAQVAPTGPTGAATYRTQLLSDFQVSMQQFLQVQRNVFEARCGAGVNSHPDPTSSATSTALAAPAHKLSEARPCAPSTSLPQVPARSTAVALKPWRFLNRIREHLPGERLIAECELDLVEHRFLRDHTFFGRHLTATNQNVQALPIMPLAMTLELMAEAAQELRPKLQVVAVAQIVTFRWLALEHSKRRVRIVARAEDETHTRVEVISADGDTMNARISEAVVEHGQRVPTDLGATQLDPVKAPPPAWEPSDLYGPILYHGPAFQGIEVVDRCGPDGLRARVRRPDPQLLFSNQSARELLLPVTLIDTASQLPGLANFGRRHEEGVVTLAFPNTTERVEFGSGAANPQPLVATARYRVDGSKLRSDVELATADGKVMLRYAGRVEEIVQFPLRAYAYAANPRRSFFSQTITDLFSDVQGIEKCTVVELDRMSDPILVNRLWSEVLARMTLNATELEHWGLQRRPPVHAIAWLLGRIAAKDAVRLHDALDVCSSDVSVESDPQGKPFVKLGGAVGPTISISHKGLHAVAVAARGLPGVGIDIEPLKELDRGVISDAFESTERERIADTQGGFAAAWTAKEAIGKALGIGFAGGPASIKIVEAVPQVHGNRYLARLAGPAAAALSRLTAASGSLSVTSRIHGAYVVSLCLIQHESDPR